MLEKAELGIFVTLVEEEVVLVDADEAKEMLDSKDFSVAPVRLVFLSTWTARKLVSNRKYGPS